MTKTRLSIPLLASSWILAIGLASSPVAIDGHTMTVGDNAAFAQRGGGHGAGGGPGDGHGAGGGPGDGHGTGSGPGGGPGHGDGPGGPSPGDGMGMWHDPMPPSGMKHDAGLRMMDPQTIQWVQHRLNQLDYHAGPVDGMMGPMTRMAIRAYQTHMGLVADGALTPDLVGHMCPKPCMLAPVNAD